LNVASMLMLEHVLVTRLELVRHRTDMDHGGY
jgi:hypothetical protein